MHLRHTRTRPRRPLHHAQVDLTTKANPKDLLDALAKILPDDLLDLLPTILRRIIEHPREHLLELGRQHRALHGYGLADLEVQAAVRAEQVEEPLCIARVQSGDGLGQGRVGSEVDLVVGGDEGAEGEGSRAAREGGEEEGAVDGVDGGEAEGEVEEAPAPLAGTEVLSCGRGFGQGIGRWWYEGGVLGALQEAFRLQERGWDRVWFAEEEEFARGGTETC